MKIHCLGMVLLFLAALFSASHANVVLMVSLGVAQNTL